MSRIMPTYRRYPVRLVRGEGLRVWDDAGREYLDFAAGIAAVPLGHGHPAWIEAVRQQLDRLVHVSNLYSTGPQEELAERLASLAGFGSLVFFCNSGAEANEAALKLARKHGGGRTKIVALQGSFHGRTFATLAATGQPEKRAPFEPLVEGFVHVPPNGIGALKETVGDETAAVFMEPILGEGGIVPLDHDFLRTARDLCDEHGALLVFDEVQTGVGRCGRWFAFQGAGVDPDVFTLAKGLANGLPIGACVAREDVSFGPGEHASTFGGGPVPCAGALAVLDIIEREGLLENALVQGRRLSDGLAGALSAAGLPGTPRGAGLLIGAPVGGTGVTSGEVVRGLMARGFLATEAGGDVVRCSPPLTVDAATIDSFVAAFAEAAAEARRLAPAEAAP